ncbi:MAG TPA: hypothetical protein VMR54_16585 [Thermoanaerobaculia bacterium]|nr:hypothetical protein [Thermoanaerobaculia bacterium]
MRRSPAASAILVGGSIAGVLDITYAIVFSAVRGFPPLRVLQSVAGGLLGAKTFEGGLPTAALGLFLHFLIAFTWASIFFAASRLMPSLARHAVWAGVLYGAVIYLVMYLVVLPLSAYPRKVTFTPFLVAVNLSVHMFLIGLSISLAVRRASRPLPSGG